MEMNIVEKINEVFNSEKEEVLDIINIENKYQIAKVKCDNKFVLYFPFIEGKRCFYNFGINTLESAIISAIAESNKTSNYVDGCCKLLNVE
jgi:hypothetical protein